MEYLNQIEVTIADLEAKIKLAASLEKLVKSREFKLVFTEGFLKEHMLQMVSLASSPSEQVAIGAMNAIKAKGAIESYQNYIFREGESAKAALAEYEAERLKQMNAAE